MIAPELSAAIDAVAAASVLLVASDYDGTLAELVDHPDEATPHPTAMVALRALAALPRTQVAVITGRGRRDVTRVAHLPPEIVVVGSHGTEFSDGVIRGLDERAARLLRALGDDLDRIAAATPGARVEHKPASAALHYRTVDAELVHDLVEQVLTGPAARDGVHVKLGKRVIELAVVDGHKGTAVEHLRAELGADAVVFIGDDVTDEDAFTELHGLDLGVKVGHGATIAGHRVNGPAAVGHVLAQLAERRLALQRMIA
jgi:trehalose-phosphatase